MQPKQNSNPEARQRDVVVTPATETEERPIRLQAIPRWAVIGIFLLLLIAGIAYARAFLMPVVLAFLLALVFTPVRRFLERRGVPSGITAALIVGMLVAALSTGIIMLAQPVGDWVDRAPEIGREVEQKLRQIMGSAQAVIEVGEKVNEITRVETADAAEVVVRKPGVVESFATVAPNFLAQTLFTLVLLLFLLASGDMFYEKIVHVMPTFGDKRQAMRLAHDIEQKLSRYLFTITLINAGLGVAIGTAMWLLGMPYPALFGLIAFAFNFVPYLGAIAGVMIATLVGLMTFDQVGYAFLAGAVYLALTSIEGQIVTPYFVGRSLRMNPVVIFLSIAFWAWAWSVIGMLVAVPLLVTIRAFCDHIPRLEALRDFLSARGSEVADDEENAAAHG